MLKYTLNGISIFYVFALEKPYCSLHYGGKIRSRMALKQLFDTSLRYRPFMNSVLDTLESCSLVTKNFNVILTVIDR